MIKSMFNGELMGSTDPRQVPLTTAFGWGYFKANTDNSGNVYVGSSSDVSIANGSTDTITTGFPLSAGQVMFIEGPGKMSDFWYISTNAGDELMYAFFVTQ